MTATRWKIAAVLTIVLAGLVFAGMMRSRDSDMAHIRACMQGKNMVLCTTPAIKNLLAHENASQIIDDLSKNLSPVLCHAAGHVVGQQLYIKEQNIESTLQQCTQRCDSACAHGAIGEAFAEELGFGDPTEAQDIDLSHMSIADLKKMTARLCISPTTCHGVGHTVFQATKNMRSAMDMCDKLTSDNVSSCYNGATMEYADILTTKNMRSVSGIKPPSVDSLKSLCILPSLTQERACFRYFQRYVVNTLEPQGYSKEYAANETRKICDSYPAGNHRIACITGIGTFSSPLVLTDTASAERECESFLSLQDKASCIFGEVMISTWERDDKIASYCSGLKNETLKKTCFQGLFHLVYAVGNAVKKDDSLCKAKDPLCEEGYKNYLSDPWTELLKI